jgi:hypothetical protein
MFRTKRKNVPGKSITYIIQLFLVKYVLYKSVAERVKRVERIERKERKERVEYI